MKQSIESLRTTGVASLPYPPELRLNVRQAAQLWEQFCQLPRTDKEQLSTNNSGAGSGYEYKDGTGVRGDYKENFDVAVTDQAYLEGLLLQQPADSTERTFVQLALDLSRAMTPLAMEFAQQAEHAFNLPGFTKNVEHSQHTIFVRFLHYFGDRTTGDILAEPHTDQSGFTFHLFETASGCQRLDYDTNEWVDMPVAMDTAAVIPAMQLQYESSGTLRALTHRVVATEGTRQFGRSAIVCFVRLADTPIYDKTTHGRLQEKQPGFNYHMPVADFTTLFKVPEVS